MDKKEFEKNSCVKESYDKVITNITKFRFLYPILEIGLNITYLKNMNNNDEMISKLLSLAESIRSNVKIIELYPNTSKEYININKLEKYFELNDYKKIEKDFRKVKYTKKNMDIYLT